MEKLAVLVDSSKDYMPVVEYINENWDNLKIDVWVGCSKDYGFRTAEILDKLYIPLEHKILFPGRVMQGVTGGHKVGYVLGPRVLGEHFSKRRLANNALSQVGRTLMRNITGNGHTIKFGYLVLNGETSTVGRKVSAKNLTDEEAVNVVKNDLNGKADRWDFLYVEGGSGAETGVAERTELLHGLKDVLKDRELVAGGGIVTVEQFKKVTDIADCVVVGTVFEEDPTLIGKFYNEIR